MGVAEQKLKLEKRKTMKQEQIINKARNRLRLLESDLNLKIISLKEGDYKYFYEKMLKEITAIKDDMTDEYLSFRRELQKEKQKSTLKAFGGD